MNRITVSTSNAYDVLIGTDLLSNTGNTIRMLIPQCKVAIISDTNVFPIYGDIITQSLIQAGYSAFHYAFPACECSKNADTYLQILSFLAENSFTRSDLLIALGGGVVGDITGFAAATFLRGINYIQIPTSLLAMVDSSVGGKTAIDLPQGKNLVGAFYQPKLVICDITALSTLPSEIFVDGCAEVIKYAVLFDSGLFTHLSENGLDFDRMYVISRCVQWKRDVVCTDEYDKGMRQLLNLGHTLGHSIEALSEYSISHGHAVATGLMLITRCAEQSKLCSKGLCEQIYAILNKFSLTTETQYTPCQLYTHALSDKKRSGGTVNLILPEAIGKCHIHPMNILDFKTFLEAGL